MSRTDNTMPTRLQVQDGKQAMATAGGSWRGVGEMGRRANKRARRRARLELASGREPEPTRGRHDEKYCYW